VTTPVSFPAMSWWDEMAPSAVRIYGADEHLSECSSLGNSQWSCILSSSGFHASGLRVEMYTEGWRAGWGGDMTIDDLVEPIAMQECIDRSIASIELWKNQAFDSYRYTAEKLHIALDGLPTKPYQDTIDENALILDILHTCALQADEIPALIKP
ncbi:hypothetical protein, partial [Vibrio sagamiensis]|uniref:hypothetical protein n=1 Tax=Vibrio sagamiensis TaxID=512650 RepID=UPI001D0F83FE